MPQPSAAREWTIAMLHALPDDRNRYEVVGGELLVTPSPSYAHQDAALRLCTLLNAFLEHSHAGRAIMAPADVQVDAQTMVQPDVFVVPLTSGRLPASWKDAGRMLLAIEVLSSGTARADQQVKRRLYQRMGVPEYWIVDLDARQVLRWRPADGRPEVLTERIEWHPNPDGAPLVVGLTDLFSRVLGER